MKLYNSLSKKLEEFVPLNPNKVLMYVCGITPYDTTHLGHAFTYALFDILRRYLLYKDFEVNYTQNITDIDDSILKKAKELGVKWDDLGAKWTKRFDEDALKLNILKPTHYVKATGSIVTIVEIVKNLINNSQAYEKHGNVYFRVKSFPTYGLLSKFNENQMKQISMERGADPNDPLKENMLDFLLWQKSKPEEPSWDSPWGKGRPGWHIECSAMIKDYLGDQIDIHGGGRDLIYPHHESEIAQSESFTSKTPYVKYWMHTAMVMYQGEKMSKSLGNLVMVSKLLEKYDSNTIRLVLLKHHYRLPWEYFDEDVVSAQEEWKELVQYCKSPSSDVINENTMMKFEDYMDTDLQINNVIGFIQEIVSAKDKTRVATVTKILQILGFTF